MIIRLMAGNAPSKRWFYYDGTRFKTEHALIKHLDKLAV